VDAKFPLENFRRILESDSSTEQESRKAFWRDIKKHVDDISSKYILPEEGTFEFALMYIPSESIYYETIIRDESQNESISAYAIRHKVIPVSPNSFYAYLQAMVRGLKGMRIERSAQIILENLGQLEVSLGQCLSDFEKIGIHLGHARTSYEKTELRFRKLQNKLSAMGEGQASLRDSGSRELPIPADETV